MEVVAYHELPFSQRIHTLGDESESVFKEVAPLGNSEEFGWRRPSVSMARMSPFIRHKPDFYTASGHLVECMGCGRDGIVKLKEVKYDALREWNRHQEVVLWVWNSSTSEWALAPLTVVKKLVARARRNDGVKAFPNDGNVYFAIPFRDLFGDRDSLGGTL